MAEYIEKEDVVAILRNLWSRTYKGIPVYSAEIDKAITDVYDLESADAALVRRGRWVRLYNPDVDGAVYACSECAAIGGYGKKPRASFCWNCGAKMDKEE